MRLHSLQTLQGLRFCIICRNLYIECMLNLFFFFPQFIRAFGTVITAISCGGSLCYECLPAKLTVFWNLDSGVHSCCQMVLFVAVWCCMVQKLATLNLLCFWATNLLLEQHLGNKYTRKKGIGQQIREEFYFLTIRKTSG